MLQYYTVLFYAYHIDSFSPENSLFLSPETVAMQAAEQKKRMLVCCSSVVPIKVWLQ